MHDSSREVLDQQVEEFIALIDEGGLVKDEGVENVMGLRGYYLLPFGLPIHEFYLDELHYFSKSLIDSALKPHTNAHTSDFYTYWGWTAALISHLEREKVLKIYQEILSDFYLLVHSALASERYARLVSENSQFHIALSRLNPSLEELALGSGPHLAATFGFSVLEGLLKRRCSKLSPDSQINIYQGFQELMDESNVSPVIEEVLLSIDRLDRYDRDVLSRKMSGVPDLSERDSFLWFVKEQRNFNVHGEGSTQAIGSIVLTLSTLPLLDLVADLDFPELRVDVLESIGHPKTMPLIHSKTPRAYYPVEMD